MISILKGIVPKFIQRLLKRIIYFFMRIYSNCKLKRINKKKLQLIRKRISAGEPLRVAFLMQYPEIWNSLKSVFDFMNSDDRFQCQVFTFPKCVESSRGVTTFSHINEASQYCKSNNISYTEINIEDYKNQINDVDIIFVHRPYNNFLPVSMKLNKMSKHGLLCYIPYGYEFVNGVHLDFEYSEILMNNTTFYFAENSETYQYIYNRRINEFKNDSKRIFDIGYPRFDSINRIKKKQTIRRILWTPRWSLSDHNDRSYFFDYFEILLDYVLEHNELELVIRPHPLMFSYFIEMGRLTETDVANIKERVNSMKNVSWDTNVDYKLTFDVCDLLISDFSSLLIEFFATGKPIIYCGNNYESFNNIGRIMSKGFIDVKNENELVAEIDKLINIGDVTFAERSKIINMLFKSNGNVGKVISETIYQECVCK